MIAAKRSSRRKAGKPPEDRSVSKIPKISEKRRDNREEENEESTDVEDETDRIQYAGEVPYVEIAPLPTVKRTQTEIDGNRKNIPEKSFGNRAPLQSDEKAKELVNQALKNPIGITTEDLLSVSEPARQELRKLLTKRRLEKKSVSFAVEMDEIENEPMEEVIQGDKLPAVSYEILAEERNNVPKGAVVIGDPVLQYLSTLQPGERPKKITVAEESQGLRAVYPLINSVGEVESLLDGGSQIVSMAKDVAVDLKITWDPDITVHMESANRTLKQTLGLAKNVPFLFGHITIYLQVHVMEEPAYKVLLGRPFDAVTESLVKNEKDGSQSLTLTDPNTGERCVMYTHERGKPPNVLKKPTRAGFQKPSRNW
jgi:hypothetical protein